MYKYNVLHPNERPPWCPGIERAVMFTQQESPSCASDWLELQRFPVMVRHGFM